MLYGCKAIVIIRPKKLDGLYFIHLYTLYFIPAMYGKFEDGLLVLYWFPWVDGVR